MHTTTHSQKKKFTSYNRKHLTYQFFYLTVSMILDHKLYDTNWVHKCLTLRLFTRELNVGPIDFIMKLCTTFISRDKPIYIKVRQIQLIKGVCKVETSWRRSWKSYRHFVGHVDIYTGLYPSFLLRFFLSYGTTNPRQMSCFYLSKNKGILEKKFY